MKKLNQSGAIDVMFIVLLIIVVAVGGFVAYRINQADESTANSAVSTQAGSSSTLPKQSTDDSGIENTVELSTFSLVLPEGWTEKSRTSKADACVDGKVREDLVLEKGQETIQILVNDCGKGVSADVTFDYSLNEDGTSVVVNSSSKTICDDELCPSEDDLIEVFVSPANASELDDNYPVFFYTYPGDSSDDAMNQEFISIIESVVLTQAD